jgi:hypothetical protein
MTGPFESEAEARDSDEVRAVHAAFDAEPGAGRMAPHNLRMLTDACGASGVEVGAYDMRVLEYLAGEPPAICAVIAGLVRRAGEM